MAKSTPKNPKLWAAAKAAARQKFDVYPCVPLHSLAVTPHGLCTHDELVEGDSILAYDRNTKSLTWSKVLSINYFEDAPLLKLYKKNGFNLTCTPNHNWVVQRSSICPDKLVESESLNTHMNIVWTGNPLEGEGLRNFSWRKHEDWIPKILQMSPDQREVFLASAIIYDGCDQGPSSIRPNGRTFGFTQKNGNHYMATVLAAFCNGYYVSMYQKTPDIRGATIIRGKRTHNTQNLLKEPAGSAAVWCPTTAHGTWVMVQDGVICVTGNSAYANAWAAKEYKKKGGTWGGADNRVSKAKGRPK